MPKLSRRRANEARIVTQSMRNTDDKRMLLTSIAGPHRDAQLNER